MTDTPTGEPRRIIPALGPFYDRTRDLSYLIVRMTSGGMLLVHGLSKVLNRSIDGFASSTLAQNGLEPTVPLAYAVFFLETVGAVCIILGLFTRAFAAAIGIQFLIIVLHIHWGRGFGWNQPGGGWEYPLFWGLMWVAIGLRGGGPYSLDRLLGREL